MSLEDIAPWSIIYGELNRKHKEELSSFVIDIIYDYIKTRVDHGWMEKKPELYYSKALKRCLSMNLVTDKEIDAVYNMCFELYYNSRFGSLYKNYADNVKYYLDYLRISKSA